MSRAIFVSLTKQDTAIAQAIREALDELFGEFLKVHFSTSDQIEGGIGTGEDWFQWIVERVRDCDFALILVTPSSVHKPWILWEAGAVAGAALALAGNNKGLRKVRPLVYQVETSMIPSPIRDSKVQFRRGDNAADFKALLRELLNDYKNELPPDRLTTFGEDVNATIETYLKKVRKCLLDAPAVPTSTVIEEWRLRLDDVLAHDQASEVGHLHEWMDISFGRNKSEKLHPLDLRIHMRLGGLYLKNREYKRAIQQLELAREMSPRDIFVLRTLGRAHLENDDRPAVQEILNRISELDPKAYVHNSECAALAARFHREGGDPAEAAKILKQALMLNTESYYLANLLAEARIESGDTAGAQEAYRQAVKTLSGLSESNVWTNATAANAHFFLGADERAREHIDLIYAAKPPADQLDSISRGLKLVAAHVADGQKRLEALLARVHA